MEGIRETIAFIYGKLGRDVEEREYRNRRGGNEGKKENRGEGRVGVGKG